MARCSRFEDYTVGWISALPMELSAGISMLDETHHPLLQDVTDMSYVFGSIGAIYVVMACLPTYGTNSAAVVAADMRSRFRNLQFCFLVGIGGGVPSKSNDIRLGDIVVSQPDGTTGGVVQYDLGKNRSDGLQRTGWLNAPPDALLKLLSAYKAKNMDLNQIGNSSSHSFKPRSTKHLIPNLPGTDDLFHSGYDHIDGSDCSNCDSKQVIQRDNRGPMVHYGTIASGNQVIKNAKMRDELSKKIGNVLCVDMEAAGIMNTLPCLVIRGICDYADSHKNKVWQPYAATLAASFARELFPGGSERPIKKHDSTALSTVSWLTRTQYSVTTNLLPDIWSTDAQPLVGHEYFARYHLSEYDYAAVHSAYIRSRCPDTTLWILNDPRYATWHTSTSGCIWLTGKIGSGKTLVTSTVVEHVLREYKDNDSTAVLHYFCRYAFKESLTATAIVASLTQQALNYLESRDITIPSQIMKSIDLIFERKSIRFEYETVVENVLLPLLSQLDETVVVMDGLDECDTKDIFNILELARRLLKKNKAKFFLSSRESLDISNSIPNCTTISISKFDFKTDVYTYIDWRLETKLHQARITEDKRLLIDLRDSLAEKADGMILWVYLQIENIWEDCSTDIEIRNALDNLPEDLNETYMRCMNKICSSHGSYARRYAARLLPWMLVARKPFTLIELREALAINEEDGTFDKSRVPSSQTLLRSCANLITLSTTGFNIDDSSCQVTLVHHTLRQFLELVSSKHPLFQELHHLSSKKVITLPSLCIRHLLSKDYSLSVQQTGPTADLRLEAPVLKKITGSIPGFMQPFLPKVKPVTLTINLAPPPTPKCSTLPAIFYYARDQWAYITRDISPHHELFVEFQNIALHPNLTYRFHPWHPLGQSLESHCLGLLAWSIVHGHKALFNLVLGHDAPIPIRQETLGAPVPQFGALNVALLAVRYDAEWALIRMSDLNLSGVRRLLLSQDANEWNSLHHAADAGSHKVIDILHNVFHVPYKIASNGSLQSPLLIAIARKDILAAKKVMEMLTLKHKIYRIEDVEGYNLILARNKCIEDGSIELLQILDSQAIAYGTKFPRITHGSKLAFYHALKAGHVSTSVHLMEHGHYHKEWLCQDAEWQSLFIQTLLNTHDMSLISLVLGRMKVSTMEYLDVLNVILRHTAATSDVALLDLLATFFVTSFDSLIERAFHWNDKSLTMKLCQLITKADSSWTIGRLVHSAARGTSEILSQFCLNHCDDLNITDERGYTPLMCAIEHGKIAFVNLLLDSTRGVEVNINARSRAGESALNLCCKCNPYIGASAWNYPYLHCARILIHHGASAEGLDKEDPIVYKLIREGFLKPGPHSTLISLGSPQWFIEAREVDRRQRAKIRETRTIKV